VRVVAGSAERAPVISTAIVGGSLAVLAALVVAGPSAMRAVPLLGVVMFLTLTHRALFSWTSLLGILLAIVLLIPMQRFVLPGGLPFELEPYRLLAAIMIIGWLGCLLIDPRVHFRRSGLEAPMLLVLAAVLISIVANPGRIAPVETFVIKGLTFFVSFIFIFYLIVSVVRASKIDLFIKVLVAGGAIVALESVIESRTHHNLFNSLPKILPFLREGSLNTVIGDERGYRVYASAQHPIALGALLIVLLPPAIYLIKRTGQRRWWLAGALLGFGSLATMSRTSVLMLTAVALVYLWLRPAETRKLWPWLVPALAAIHLVLPGTLGTLKDSFFPKGGLVAEQTGDVGAKGQGRVADIGPSLREFAQQPLFGEGYASRRTDIGSRSVQILDDQWLGNLLETGLLGTGAWVWLFVRSVRRLGRRGKEDTSDLGWLAVALAASTTTFAVGMLTYDAFAFSQVTLVLFVLLALGSVFLSGPRVAGPRAVRASA
jgi:polysaccharide biosynthesis protein PslJ